MRHSWRGTTLRAPWGPGLFVAIVTIFTFLSVLRNDFVSWDDIDNFLKNPNYRGLGWTNIRWMFTTAHLGHYIPVTWLTLGLDYVLWGMNPRGYHLTAILLHATNALLFYVLAYRVLAFGFASSTPEPNHWRARQEDPPQHAPRADRALVLGAVTAALLFSVH